MRIMTWEAASSAFSSEEPGPTYSKSRLDAVWVCIVFVFFEFFRFEPKATRHIVRGEVLAHTLL